MNVDRLLIKAKSSIKKGDLQSAIKIYKQIQEKYPQNKIANDALNKLLNLSSTKQVSSGKVNLNNASKLYSLGKYTDALKILNSLAADYSNDAELFHLRALCLWRLQLTRQAMADFKQAIALTPDFVFALYNFANFLKSTGDLVQAEHYFSEAIKIKSDFIEAYCALAFVLSAQGKLESAAKNYKIVLKAKPNLADEHYNYGGVCNKLEQYDLAIESYKKALKIKPKLINAYINLASVFSSQGNIKEASVWLNHGLKHNPGHAKVLQQLGCLLWKDGQFEKAVQNFQQVIEIEPDNAPVYNNLGCVLYEQKQFEVAVNNFMKALSIEPNNPEFIMNSGNNYRHLGKNELAMDCYNKVIDTKPDFVSAHVNLGFLLNETGKLEDAVNSFLKAIYIDRDNKLGWYNIFFPLKTLIFNGIYEDIEFLFTSKGFSDDIFESFWYLVLIFQLNTTRVLENDKYFLDTIKTRFITEQDSIINPYYPSQKTKSVSVPDNMVALMHWGRSGTGLLHSLLDSHSEITTFPSIYFSEFFKRDNWEKLISRGWEYLPEQFVNCYSVLFDSRSSSPVETITGEYLYDLGKDEGMTMLGANQDEFLSVDADKFCRLLYEMMGSTQQLNQMDFFKMAHVAYEKTLKHDFANKNTCFYHIHNPSPMAKLNFINHAPRARFLVMVREPLQSCESWVRKPFLENELEDVYKRIVTMLMDIDQLIYRCYDSVGVRLEDLKSQPEKTMARISEWLGVKEEPIMYEMTAQGRKWWGDPSSPNFGKTGMSLHGSEAIKRRVGYFFDEQDQFILHTLFYPFSVRFGYIDENRERFVSDLDSIKSLLEGPFGFEEKSVARSGIDLEEQVKSGPAMFFRAALKERWKVLNEFYDYPHMLTPLGVNIT